MVNRQTTIPKYSSSEPDEGEMTDYLEHRRAHLDQVAQKAVENLHAVQEQQCEMYRRRCQLNLHGKRIRTSEHMQPDSLIWQLKPLSARKGQNRLGSKMEGPYILHEWQTPTLAVTRDGNDRKWTRHISQLAPYDDQGPELKKTAMGNEPEAGPSQLF